MESYRKHISGFFAVLALLFLGACTQGPYFNHMFNAERAMDEGLELRQARLDSLPEDTIWATEQEKAKYDRVIEKSSRLLERFPKEVKYKPMAVFYIGEAFRLKGQWSKALIKYDEFEKFFSDHDSMPSVEYQRAFTYYKNGDFSLARFAVERVIEKGKDHLHYNKALNLLSLLEERDNSPDKAIDALEKLLASGEGTPFIRAKAYMRLATLYFKEKQYDNARKNYQVSLIRELSSFEQYLAAYQAAECLYFLKNLPDAIVEMSALLLPEEWQNYRNKTRIRFAEYLLDNREYNTGLDELLKVVQDSARSVSASHAWFVMGDFEQITRKDLEIASQHFDSSLTAMPSSPWALLAKDRRASIEELIRYRAKKNASPDMVTRRDDFLIAELFLFKLDEVDSALQTLDKIVAKPDRDSLTHLRAAYARAFIWDEFKGDSTRADSLYKYVITNFPKTEFARQAQKNLGLEVTVQTNEDFATKDFLKAESKYMSIDSLPVDSIGLIESVFREAMLLYDSVTIKWPGTEYAAKALFTRAWIFENESFEVDSARAAYQILAKDYSRTPYGATARTKLSPKIEITEQELDRLRKRLQTQKVQDSQTRDSYRQRFKQPVREETQEELKSDYDALYNF